MPKPHASVILASMYENYRLNSSVKTVNDLLDSLQEEFGKRNELGFILLNEIKVLGRDILCSGIKVSQKTCEFDRIAQYLKALTGLDQHSLLRKLGDDCWAAENKTLVATLDKTLGKFLKKEPLVDDNKEKVSVSLPRAKL